MFSVLNSILSVMRYLTLMTLGFMALTACTPTQPPIQVPQIEVDKIRLSSLTLPTNLSTPAVANLDMRLRITNPNPVPVKLANVYAKLILDGLEVGEMNLPNVSLPADGETLQDAKATVPVTLKTAKAFLKIARGQESSYRLDGTFTADLGVLGTPSFGPFTISQGIWKQKPIIPF